MNHCLLFILPSIRVDGLISSLLARTVLELPFFRLDRQATPAFHCSKTPVAALEVLRYWEYFLFVLFRTGLPRIVALVYEVAKNN